MLLCVICLYSFAFTISPRVLSVRLFIYLFFKHSFQHLLSLVDFFLGLVAHSFFLSFYYSLIFLIIIFYFNNFTLFNLFISFFLPFLLSHVADSVLVLQLGVRPEPLRWESRVQDIGPPQTSWPHVISISESCPRDLHLNAKTQLHSMSSKLQCWTPHAKQLAREHNPTHQQRGCLKSY